MADTLDLLTLAEARKFLNIDGADTSEDDELADFITGITPVVESGDANWSGIGPVVLRSRSTIIYGASANAVPAPVWPIDSLTSGAYLLDDSPVDVSAMVVDQGLILTKDGSALPLRPWTLTYQAGFVADTASVPQNIKKGAAEILRLAWASQRLSDPPAFLVPFRAMHWFGANTFALGFA